MLYKIVVPARQKVKRNWIRILFTLHQYLGEEIKKDVMAGECSIHGRNENSLYFSWQTWRKQTTYRNIL